MPLRPRGEGGGDLFMSTSTRVYIAGSSYSYSRGGAARKNSEKSSKHTEEL